MKKIYFFKLLLVCLIAAFTSDVYAQENTQTLTAIEQKMLKDIEANMPSTIKLLKESVNINSGTYNIEGVKKVGAMYSKELAALGFTIEWIKMPDSLKRAGHLVAYKKGKKGKKVFVIGHLDTVFEPDMPPNPYTMLNDSTVTGQGVNDMKGGDVIVIAALKAMHQQGLLNDVSMTIYFTGDEENAGNPREVSRGDFIERAKKHDVALGFEGAAGLNTIATARRGASSWVLEVEAEQGHSAGVFGKGGYGSIYEAARIVNTFREKLSTQPFLTFNPGLFIGGSEINVNQTAQQGDASGKTNIISPKTVVIGDLRFLSEKQKNDARDTMRQIVAQNLKGTRATIKFQDGIPSMPPTVGNDALVKVVSDISIRMGLGEVKAGDPGSRGAGDISYVADYLDCLDGFGASGKGAHAPGETTNLNDLPKLIKRAALVFYKLTQ
jgi:glutamate carboxypeptidase